MNFPLKNLLFRTKPQQEAGNIVSVQIMPEGIAMVYGNGNTLDDFTIKACAYEFASDLETKKQKLLDFVVLHELQGYPCNYILSEDYYTLSLIETPKVPPSEVNESARWLIRDYIEYPVEDAVIDLFELPLPRITDSTTMSYVAIIHSKWIPEIEETVREAGLSLETIDIPELCLRNIVYPAVQDNSSYMSIRFSGGIIKIASYIEQDILITRRMDFPVDDGQVITDQNLEDLLLDVQRSLDYCDSLFKADSPKTIIVSPSEYDEVLVKEYLEHQLGITTNIIKIEEHVNFDIELTNTIERECLVAIGGCMRDVIRNNNATS